LSVGTIIFDPAATTYNVNLPAGTTTVIPTAVANIDDAAVSGAGAVTLAADGSGISTITVKALDGTTTKVYTINYTTSTATDLKQTAARCFYSIDKQMLTVNGTDSYVIFNVKGVKVADVKVNTTGKSVHLNSGIYFLKTNTSEVLKVIIR